LSPHLKLIAVPTSQFEAIRSARLDDTPLPTTEGQARVLNVLRRRRALAWEDVYAFWAASAGQGTLSREDLHAAARGMASQAGASLTTNACQPPGALQVFTSSASVEWYTPAWLVKLVRRAFRGVIDFDPASCAAAKAIVKARQGFAFGLRSSS
jgi:hypothetical protein